MSIAVSEQSPSLLYIVVVVIGFIPSVYFAWMVLKGIILSLRRSKDDDL